MAEKSSKEEKDILSKAVSEFYKKHIQDNAYWDHGIVYSRLDDRMIRVTSAAFKPPPGIHRYSPAFKDAQKLVDKLIAVTNECRIKQWQMEQGVLPFQIALETVLSANQRKGYKTPENHQSKPNEIAELNARELIQEEEAAKSRGQKKRSKKQRQNQKKEEIKQFNFTNVPPGIERSTQSVSQAVKSLTLSDADGNAVNFGENSTFLSQDPDNKNKQPVPNDQPTVQNAKEVKCVKAICLQALELIDKKEYKEAIHKLSKAIDLEPTRTDLLLTRSRVYFEIGKYQKSLQDAENRLKIVPYCLEGHYRLREANRALKLDGGKDFLTSLHNGTVSKDDLYYSDEEDSEVEHSEVDEELNHKKADNSEKNEGISNKVTDTRSHQGSNTFTPINVIDKTSLLLVDPMNPFKCCSLYVENMKRNATSEEIQDVFAKFGKICSIKVARGQRVYAIVKYNEWQSAREAMRALQGSHCLLCTAKPLVIKYPVKILNELVWHMFDTEIVPSKPKAKKEQTYDKHKPKPNLQPLLNRGHCSDQHDAVLIPSKPPVRPSPGHVLPKRKPSVQVVKETVDPKLLCPQENCDALYKSKNKECTEGAFSLS